MRAREYSVQEVFLNTLMGLRFEFFSSKKPEFIVEDLGKILAKHILITGDEKMTPTWASPILLKEYNGKKPRYQLKIAQQDFLTLGTELHSILEWIKENAALDYSTKLFANISFNHRNLQTLSSISNMDIGKMILKIDENFLYNKFPLTDRSPFSLSIKKLIPYDGFMNTGSSLNSLNNSFQLPIAEHYGIDFTQQTIGIIGFNYIGGPKYAMLPHDVNESLKYYILSTYQVLNTVGFTTDMKYEMDKLMGAYSKYRRCYNEPTFFLNEFKDIKVTINLKLSEQAIKLYWSRIRGPLLRLIMEGNLRKGFFNWDSDIGKFELKDANISGSIVSNINLINCKIYGLIENCNLWRCNIENSRITSSTIVAGNNITASLIEGCRADKTNIIDKSYIINKGEIINCKVNESIIKNAGIGHDAKLDDECTVIADRVKIQSPPDSGIIKPNEIRDYRWIKAMNKTEDKGFQNEFKIKY